MSSRWCVGRCMLVLLAAGLVAAPGASGADVRRIPTRDGTLVADVGDPAVKVSVDEEKGEVAIAGAGDEEIRFRPGQHPSTAPGDGKGVTSDLISISRGGRLVVRIRLEPAGASPAPAPEKPAADTKAAVKPASPSFPGESPAVLGADDRQAWFAVISPDGKTLAMGGT